MHKAHTVSYNFSAFFSAKSLFALIFLPLSSEFGNYSVWNLAIWKIEIFVQLTIHNKKGRNSWNRSSWSRYGVQLQAVNPNPGQVSQEETTLKKPYISDLPPYAGALRATFEYEPFHDQSKEGSLDVPPHNYFPIIPGSARCKSSQIVVCGRRSSVVERFPLRWQLSLIDRRRISRAAL